MAPNSHRIGKKNPTTPSTTCPFLNVRTQTVRRKPTYRNANMKARKYSRRVILNLQSPVLIIVWCELSGGPTRLRD
jgi:hypothetical protein